MQINIDKKTGILLGVIGVLATALVATAAPKFLNDSDGQGHSMMNNQSKSQPGNEVMFYQMMIPHHEQAIEISQLALKTSKNVELLKLAQNIFDGQSAEVKLMNSWLREGGNNSDMGHMNHGGMSESGEMGGMLSESELSTLESKTGKSFDIYWLQRMIVHHEGAIHMVMMIEDSNDSNVRNFATDIESVQSAQITQMQKMLKSLGA